MDSVILSLVRLEQCGVSLPDSSGVYRIERSSLSSDAVSQGALSVKHPVTATTEVAEPRSQRYGQFREWPRVMAFDKAIAKVTVRPRKVEFARLASQATGRSEDLRLLSANQLAFRSRDRCCR
jgi:hypothetical protein